MLAQASRTKVWERKGISFSFSFFFLNSKGDFLQNFETSVLGKQSSRLNNRNIGSTQEDQTEFPSRWWVQGAAKVNGSNFFHFHKFSTTILLTRMHSSRMLTARLLTVSWRGVCPTPIYANIRDTDRGRPPWGQTLLDADPPPQSSDLSCMLGSQPPLDAGHVSPLWTEWLTNRCKNITLPQTSFAGGKNKVVKIPPGGSLNTWTETWCKGFWREIFVPLLHESATASIVWVSTLTQAAFK